MSINLFRNIINVAFIDWEFLYKIIWVTLLSWGPLLILKKAKSFFFPNDH